MNTIDVDTAARHCPSREWGWRRRCARLHKLIVCVKKQIPKRELLSLTTNIKSKIQRVLAHPTMLLDTVLKILEEGATLQILFRVRLEACEERLQRGLARHFSRSETVRLETLNHGKGRKGNIGCEGFQEECFRGVSKLKPEATFGSSHHLVVFVRGCVFALIDK
jgi:hypothetical protein